MTPPGCVPTGPLAFLAGGGEMGERIRAFDWATTPLGPVERWPQSLRSAIGMLLPSKTQIILFWGADFTVLYNDAYRSVFGGKHPWALGQAGRSAWSEVWEGSGLRGLLEGVVATGDAFWASDRLFVINRSGYAEETYFDVSYDPVRGEDGAVAGVYCIVTETTGRVLGERRLKTLRDLGAPGRGDSVEDACRGAARVLGENRHDVPFALVYLVDAGDQAARLIAATGLEEGSPAAPSRIALAGQDTWPLRVVQESGRLEIVTGLRERLGELPGGAWPEPAHAAVVLPLARAGQNELAGFLVTGVTPRRALDGAYLDFLGLVAGHVGTAIANARALEEERRRAETLAELDRAKTAFFTNVSHEFRTPLTLMLGPVRDLLSQPADGLAAEGRTLLEVVHRNGQRLLRLVNTLLDFSRIEAGRLQAAYAPTDLAVLTADLASQFRSACERAGLELVVDCPALPEPVYVDPDMWEKVVLNLLSNALKFTLEGSIHVSQRAADDTVELEVRDTGTGIPGEELPHVFERFHRVQGGRARTHEGSGIGLALVRELVQMHGGRVAVASAPDRGTTFTVSVPLGTAHLPADRIGAAHSLPSTRTGADAYVEGAAPTLPADVLEEVPAASATSAAGSSHVGRVLVADDNADMRDYLARLLGTRWTVEAVPDGQAALEVCRARRPDLVLTDMMMPRLDGFGVLRALRADPATRDLPVIMLSARAGEEAQVEGLGMGADDYVVKPFSARELVARVGARIELSRMRARLEEQRALVREVFAHTPMPVGVFRGPDLVVEVTNDALHEVWGRRPVHGRPLLDAVPELRGQGQDDLMRTVMSTGVPYAASETRIALLRDGVLQDTYWTFVYAPAGRSEDGADAVVAVATDVTEQVAARRQLQQLVDAAASASRAKDEFLAMLGHELRNPLAPILTALDVIRLRGLDTREHDVIRRQVRHLVRLIDDLLDVSRIARGKVELRRQRIELAEVVVRAVEQVSPVLEAGLHELAIDVVREGLPLDVDPDRLAQVVANLLSNAAKYSPASTRIELGAERDGALVRLWVQDHGDGMAADVVDRVFNLFYQAPQTLERDRGGLGLGLAIVRSLVELHGGTVSAHSEGAGRGSRFTVELPFSPDAAAAVAQARPGRAPATGERRRILVVDDNEDAADTMAEALALFGHEVRVAHDGPSALVKAEGFDPHLGLLDIGLPAMDGYELAQRLRGVHPRLLLYAVTGYGQDADRRRALEAGFDGLLVKPVDVEQLRGMLAEPALGS